MQDIKNINTLIIGQGGREHALLWKIQQSEIKGKIFVAPGSDKMLKTATKAPIDIDNHQELTQFCKKNQIHLCIVGPEAPLEKGIADYLRKNNINVFAPNKNAAKIETSKIFAKKLCQKYNIPTAKFYHTSQYQEALEIIEKQQFPLVVKADGIAAGKGVIIAQNKTQAINAFNELSKISENILFEEFIDGIEASFFVLTDGTTNIPFASAKDYKKSHEGNTGLNTGGMGAISPSPDFTKEIQDKTMKNIVAPTLEALKQENAPYQGILYFGIMIKQNEPYLLEYNARFGDPECQAILSLYQGDLLELCYKTALGKLNEIKNPEKLLQAKHSVVIVIVNEEYPLKNGSDKRQMIIQGIENAEKNANIIIFHAGTKYQNSKWLANGGRVINCCAIHEDRQTAIKNARNTAKNIFWEKSRFRNDIGE